MIPNAKRGAPSEAPRFVFPLRSPLPARRPRAGPSPGQKAITPSIAIPRNWPPLRMSVAANPS